MTRLEEIEAWVETQRLNPAPTGVICLEDADLLYALDCYKARVAVLEEAAFAGRKYRELLSTCANDPSKFTTVQSVQDETLDVLFEDWEEKEDLAIILTPEECLERQSRTHKDSLLVEEEE